MRLKTFLFVLMLFCMPAYGAAFNETTIPDSFGVNIHFLDKDLDEHIALLKEAGFKWVRKDLDWGSIEQKKGIYNFERYDRQIDALNHAGIKVLLILDYSNPHYDDNFSPYTLEGRKAFVEFTKAAAKRYATKQVAWEIYNEPNIGFWKPMPHVDNYIALATDVTRALKQIIPDQAILAPALAGPTTEPAKANGSYHYLDFVLHNPVAKQWSAISVHPYRAQDLPEAILNEMPKLKRLLRKHGITAPIVFTEWGYHTAAKNIDEETQAAYAARSFLLASALHMPFSIWYNWQEAGNDHNEPEHQYGLVRYGDIDPGDETIKKPAFKAIHMLSQQLAGYRFDAMTHSSNGIYCLRFKKEKQIAFAAWTTRKTTQPFDLSLPSGRTRLELHTMPLIIYSNAQ